MPSILKNTSRGVNIPTVSFEDTLDVPAFDFDSAIDLADSVVDNETKKLDNIEENYQKLTEHRDLVTNVPYDNERQRKAIESARQKHGIHDDLYNVGTKELEDSFVVNGIGSNVTSFMKSREINEVVKEQSNAAAFRESINGMDANMARIAMQDYMDYVEGGADGNNLLANKYVKTDWRKGIRDRVGQLEQEFDMEVDEKGGFKIISKTTGASIADDDVKSKEFISKQVREILNDPAAMNNIRAEIGSRDGKVSEEAIQKEIETMADQILNVKKKELYKAVEIKAAKVTKADGTPVDNSLNAEYRTAGKTEGERDLNKFIDDLDSQSISVKDLGGNTGLKILDKQLNRTITSDEKEEGIVRREVQIKEGKDGTIDVEIHNKNASGDNVSVEVFKKGVKKDESNKPELSNKGGESTGFSLKSLGSKKSSTPPPNNTVNSVGTKATTTEEIDKNINGPVEETKTSSDLVTDSKDLSNFSIPPKSQRPDGQKNPSNYTGNFLNIKNYKSGQPTVNIDGGGHRVFVNKDGSVNYEEGWKASVNDVDAKLSGRSNYTTDNTTMEEMYQVFAEGATPQKTLKIIDKLPIKGITLDSTMVEMRQKGVTSEMLAKAMVHVESPDMVKFIPGAESIKSSIKKKDRQVPNIKNPKVKGAESIDGIKSGVDINKIEDIPIKNAKVSEVQKIGSIGSTIKLKDREVDTSKVNMSKPIRSQFNSYQDFKEVKDVIVDTKVDSGDTDMTKIDNVRVLEPEVSTNDSVKPSSVKQVQDSQVNEVKLKDINPKDVIKSQKELKKVGFVSTVDGVRGPNTKRGEKLFNTIKGKMGKDLEVIDFSGKIGKCDEYQCAAYNSEIGALIAGVDKKEYQSSYNSVGDAWNRFHYMKKTGAKEVKVSNYKAMKTGDVVALTRGRFSGKDESYEAANDKSNPRSTGNQHIGTIVGKDKNGTPLVAHNFHGSIYIEPINDVSRAYSYKATGVIRPESSLGVSLLNRFKDFVSN